MVKHLQISIAKTSRDPEHCIWLQNRYAKLTNTMQSK